MAAQPIVIVAHLVATSKAARDQLVSSLQQCCDYARANEPGVSKYAICLLDDPHKDTNVFVVEEYADKATYDAHMSSPPVTALLAMLKDTTPALLDASTTSNSVTWTKGALTRADRLPSQAPKTVEWDLRNRVEHPYVLFATITDPDQKDIDTLEPFGAAIVQYATENEPDTIFYGDAKPIDLTPDNPADDLKVGFICAVEVYATKEACMKHLQDQTVANLAIEGHKLGSKFVILQYNMTYGWLIRD